MKSNTWSVILVPRPSGRQGLCHVTNLSTPVVSELGPCSSACLQLCWRIFNSIACQAFCLAKLSVNLKSGCPFAVSGTV